MKPGGQLTETLKSNKWDEKGLFASEDKKDLKAFSWKSLF